ncbi:MAG: SelL-related redox protein [Cyclobacteriaceae bacterium]
MKPVAEWISTALRLAGITNVVWGLTFALFTDVMLRWASVPEPDLLFPWRAIGLITLVFGAAYIIAANDPLRHVLIISTGFFLKLIGLVLQISYLMDEALSNELRLYFALKDLPFAFIFLIILYQLFKASQAEEQEEDREVAFTGDVLQFFSTNQSKSLLKLSHEKPLLLVFLRHFGCTFCREAIGELREKRKAIEQEGAQIIFVHMGTPEEADQYFKKYGFSDAQHISDPQCVLYRHFSLRRGSFSQLFGIRSWVRGFEAGVLKGYGVGRLVGDGFRMPGVFLVYQGKLLKAYRHTHASDRPDYTSLASCELA